MSNQHNTDDLQRDLKVRFQSAYDTHSDAIFRYSFYKLSDREKAKDVVQDTFVRFWEYLASNGVIENEKAFIYRIATNAIVDNYRKRREISLDLLADDGYDHPDAEGHHKMMRSADSADALQLLNELDDKERNIMLLRYVEGLSVGEIAEVLGERENTVSVHIHRAIKELQKLFEKSVKKRG